MVMTRATAVLQVHNFCTSVASFTHQYIGQPRLAYILKYLAKHSPEEQILKPFAFFFPNGQNIWNTSNYAVITVFFFTEHDKKRIWDKNALPHSNPQHTAPRHENSTSINIFPGSMLAILAKCMVLLLLPMCKLLCFNSFVTGRLEWNVRRVILKLILVTDGWGIFCEITIA